MPAELPPNWFKWRQKSVGILAFGGGVGMGGNASGPGGRGSPLVSSLPLWRLPGRQVAPPHLPPPRYFSFNYCSLLILAPFVTNSFILVCEWLSIPSTAPAEIGESGGRGYSGEASSSPLIFPLPSPSSSLPLPGHCLPPGSSPGLAPTWSHVGFVSQPSGALLPGASCLPSRAAYSLLQL